MYLRWIAFHFILQSARSREICRSTFKQVSREYLPCLYGRKVRESQGTEEQDANATSLRQGCEAEITILLSSYSLTRCSTIPKPPLMCNNRTTMVDKVQGPTRPAFLRAPTHLNWNNIFHVRFHFSVTVIQHWVDAIQNLWFTYKDVGLE